VEKYDRDGQATDDTIIRRMRIAWWISKATDTHSEYVILIALTRRPRPTQGCRADDDDDDDDGDFTALTLQQFFFLIYLPKYCNLSEDIQQSC
jgi:hypothetical protein